MSSACTPLAASLTTQPSRSSSSRTSDAFTTLSSTTSTRRPAIDTITGPDVLPADSAAASSVRAAGRVDSGTITTKALPAPGTLCTSMRPPIIATSSLEIFRPRPVPGYARVEDSSPCWNALKIRACSLSAMPGPVSATSIRSIGCASSTASSAAAAAAVSKDTSMRTLPSAVNLIALPTRFSTTCRRRASSPMKRSGIDAAYTASTRSDLASASSANISITSSTSRRGANGAGCNEILPASICDRSSTSSISASNDCPARRIWCGSARCSGASGDSTSNWLMPRITFNGVRSSWRMLARNADLARLAASARSSASPSVFVIAISAMRWAMLRLMVRPMTCPSRSRKAPNTHAASPAIKNSLCPLARKYTANGPTLASTYAA